MTLMVCGLYLGLNLDLKRGSPVILQFVHNSVVYMLLLARAFISMLT